MTSDRLRPLPGPKTTPIISLNHYIFSGVRTKPTNFFEKPSRDDIYKKILIPKNLNKPKFQQKGLIFVWPQKRTSFFYNKEMIWLSWVVAHALYWLYVIDILPTGTAVPFKQPPWKYEPPLHRPKSRDFIIEPDWESHYATVEKH
ncbi:uncharacterized protein LOC123013222 isoform X1 [Tribolium madens]|uniref:uncharacterized protein LOC123013222 isoform X1 n=1 Tax=Tribolium madens TaxID=41895 RepID=UPI001CF72AE7|nr:uncharacterized protein LOC123013222 isoform X1 [Tribolium madens]